MATYKPRLVFAGMSLTWSSETRPGSSSIAGGTTSRFPGPAEGLIGINTGTTGTVAATSAAGPGIAYPRLEFFCSTAGSTAGKWYRLTAQPTSAASTVITVYGTTVDTT